MEEKDLLQLKSMIERLGSKDPPDRALANFEKWAGQVAECVARRDIMVVFSSLTNANAEEEDDETGNSF